jgi:membrane protein YqaA with SNARE-associated domain
MTDLYLNVLTEAARFASIVPFTSEPTFFAMKSFGGYNMPLACALAAAGAVAGQLFNWWMGTQLRGIPHKKNPDKVARFEHYKAFFNDAGMFLLLMCWVSPFGNLLAVVAGLFSVPLKKALPLVAIGEAAHYGYYLF